jgi:hypothetical protein
MFLRTEDIIPASNHLMLWVGDLTDEELLGYLNEPGGQIDGKPQSRFAEDLLRFYDHDFLWAKASSEPVSIRELAIKIGIEDQELIDDLEQRVPIGEQITCFLILWNYRNLRPMTQRFANGKVRFVASWPYPAPYTDDC